MRIFSKNKYITDFEKYGSFFIPIDWVDICDGKEVKILISDFGDIEERRVYINNDTWYYSDIDWEEEKI